jgi:hypothetical protein
MVFNLSVEGRHLLTHKCYFYLEKISYITLMKNQRENRGRKWEKYCRFEKSHFEEE